MTESKSLLEQALDVCLYAPVGLAISVTEELPQLIDKGRARVNSQLALAKMVGSFAVAQGQREAERVVRQATGRVAEAPLARGPRWSPPGGGPEPNNGDGATTTFPDDGTAATVAADGGAPSDGGTGDTPPASSASSAETIAQPPTGWTPAIDAGALAIPGYDALSASQVVQRLAGLAADELEAVRTYEASTRGRKTILNRIAQLQAPGRG
jgi:hypothetical protein